MTTKDLVTLQDPRSPIAEAYRGLRTNLTFSSLDRPLRTMLITSAGPEEGKSTVLANLAVTEAQAGRRVIIVDADLRRPRQHELFGISNATGLTTALADEKGLQNLSLQATVLQATEVPGLRVLTSGPLPPNPTELLASQRMAALLTALSALSDLVLFDAPPVVVVTDAAILASQVDGVLLVVNANGTRREHAQRAQQLLAKVNARIVGSVLNNAAPDRSLRPYYR
ncbi:MAG: CpsD/CapB family tyrosine-protein kinase [Anaerolineae bacterium]|jgi:non-specific protein-tyrosine kinase|uniref:CpsD/CapB family tyrosine-protein kinase n=1 Tax=Candidatus Amarolinea dominans TaxID=3140696 RepID=UPI001D631AD1|nr:CpsD/CapB family tyrosine-protein kinase [Anaerolineae bacterium]MBK9091655.1 CpsD/CapB family tyrosine-protein kinase [Anaerolineae bacterium]MBK9230260.1 CpsD/CapB family tyrosine-protein kinase [Anaerolineae bacterium]